MNTEPWYWVNDNTRAFMARGYLVDGQTTEERVRAVGEYAEKTLGKKGFADKFEEYMSKGWISLATPVWANFGLDRGLPISCFGSYVGDDMANILHTQGEVGMMSKYGGGCSAYFGDLRPRGAEIRQNGYSSGPVHFMQLFEKILDVVSQGATRRGTFAAYLPVEHPDILEHLDIGTEGNPIQKINHAVTVGDEWMQAMIDGDEAKRKVWAKIIQRRGEIGYPYIIFIDNANNQKPDVYKDKNLPIYASNVCSEIMLPSNKEWSFVCCLSSINLMHYDDWKDTDLVETMTWFLDAVMTSFIERLESLRDSEDEDKRLAFKFMERPYNFAVANRALGLGVLGYHSYLQSKMIPFASDEAAKINREIFELIHDRSYKASAEMAKELGEPEVLKGYGRRNTTTMAIAPTTSSAFILGQVSQGIEPIWSNCYIKDLAKLKVVIKNPLLEKLLEEKGKNDKTTWDSIRDADGSVQHLDCLSEEEKDVFRTFAEIDQSKLIEIAAERQKFIDQGQSLNVMVPPDVPAKEINQLYIKAWKEGCKALYYQHSMNAAQQMVRKKLAAKEGKEL
ncbi:ribonucleoside-diphosphate reductase subunit alpha [Candidatus Kaiserbacteria bacterium]|nr:ribonucleoside-diphosphate reductase subunit alpha [Candidatus Kaiserbacteria bacterium]